MVTYLSKSEVKNTSGSILDYRFVKTLPAFKARFMGKHNDHGFKRGALYNIRLMNMAVQKRSSELFGITFGEAPMPMIRIYSLVKGKKTEYTHKDFVYIEDFINEWRIRYE